MWFDFDFEYVCAKQTNFCFFFTHILVLCIFLKPKLNTQSVCSMQSIIIIILNTPKIVLDTLFMQRNTKFCATQITDRIVRVQKQMKQFLMCSQFRTRVKLLFANFISWLPILCVKALQLYRRESHYFCLNLYSIKT